MPESKQKPDDSLQYVRFNEWIQFCLIALAFLFLLDVFEANLPIPMAYGAATTLYCALMGSHARKQPTFVWWRWSLMSLFAGIAMILFCIVVNVCFGVFWALTISR